MPLEPPKPTQRTCLKFNPNLLFSNSLYSLYFFSCSPLNNVQQLDLKMLKKFCLWLTQESDLTGSGCLVGFYAAHQASSSGRTCDPPHPIQHSTLIKTHGKSCIGDHTSVLSTSSTSSMAGCHTGGGVAVP